MIYILADKDGKVQSVASIQGEDYIAYKGTLPPRPTTEDDTEPRLMLVDGQLVWQVGKSREEISALRAQAYRDRVDPITCEISRLRDMDGAFEDIADAMARRDDEVAKIKAELPYNE